MNDELWSAFNAEQTAMVNFMKKSGQYDHKKFIRSRDRAAFHNESAEKKRLEILHDKEEMNGKSKLDIIVRSRREQLENNVLTKAKDKLVRQRAQRDHRIARLINEGRSEYASSWNDDNDLDATSDGESNKVAVSTPTSTSKKEVVPIVTPTSDSDKEIEPVVTPAKVTPTTSDRKMRSQNVVKKY
jgi:hypothetical protein